MEQLDLLEEFIEHFGVDKSVTVMATQCPALLRAEKLWHINVCFVLL
jgi:hypothetical protein